MRKFAQRCRQLSWLAAALVLSGSTARKPPQDAQGEWRAYGGSNASAKYSPLDQIGAANVRELKIAW